MKKVIILTILAIMIIGLFIPQEAIAEGDKVIYLTFDDGPSDNTEKILDILKMYNIKATFFVVKRECYNNTYRRIINEGHTLAGHTASHRYHEIYKSEDSYYNDLNELNNYVYSITKHRFDIIRFPGGSNNTISKRYSDNNIMIRITERAIREGYIYYDWNVDSYDANDIVKDSALIADAVIRQCKTHKMNIVLMHDSPYKTTTPDSLPIIINTMRDLGYRFDRITDDTKVIKFI